MTDMVSCANDGADSESTRSIADIRALMMHHNVAIDHPTASDVFAVAQMGIRQIFHLECPS